MTRHLLKALTVAVLLLAATSAFAVTYTYNPGGHVGDPVRVVQTIYSGWNITQIVTVTQPNGCKKVTVTTYAFWIKTSETTGDVCP